MLTLTVLASSSEANCSLVRSGATTIMVDCGLPRAQCVKALAECGVDPESVSAVVLTHAHGDHAGGLNGFAGRFNIPVYCSRGEATALRIAGCALPLKQFRSDGESFLIGDIEVQPFIVPHDSSDPVGFQFSSCGQSISYATDLGWIPPDVESRLLASDLLFIEANYDPDILRACIYPRVIKVRIVGGAGHLSNEQTCEMLTRIDGVTKTVILGHVSTTSNDPELVSLMAQKALAGKGVRLLLATDVIGKPIWYATRGEL